MALPPPRRADRARRRSTRRTATPCSSASRTSCRQPIVGARRHADRRHAPRAQRLEHRVDAVDRMHSSRRRTKSRTISADLRALLSFVIVTSFQRAHERRRALAAADDRRDARRRGQLGAAIDRRHRQIELRALRRGRSARRESDGTAPSPSARPRLHPVRDRAKSLAIEPRRRRQLLGQRARRPRARRRRCISSRTPAIAERRAPRRSRTETPAAPAPGSADRPTRSPSPSPTPETRGRASSGVIAHAGLVEIRQRQLARAAPDRPSSGSAGSPRPASPRRTRRRCGRRASSENRRASSSIGSSSSPSPGDQPISAR